MENSFRGREETLKAAFCSFSATAVAKYSSGSSSGLISEICSLGQLFCKIHNRFRQRKDLISAKINIWSLSWAPHICHCNHYFGEVFLVLLVRCPCQGRPSPTCFTVFPAVLSVAVLDLRCGLFPHSNKISLLQPRHLSWNHSGIIIRG